MQWCKSSYLYPSHSLELCHVYSEVRDHIHITIIDLGCQVKIAIYQNNV